MYGAIDIGGTKTLIAVFDPNGNKMEEVKFATSEDYQQFLKDLTDNVAQLSTKQLLGFVVAVPGLLDRENGVVKALGNLPWRNKPIRDDISSIVHTPVTIENDSRLAGLGAAQPLKSTFKNILYLTVSTGIGGALISDGQIVKPLEDMEVGKIPVMFDGKIQHWEDFAAGRAVVTNYGKRASEIDDSEAWQEIGQKLAYGTAIISSTIQPDVIVFGGGVGQFADKFIPTIQAYMDDHLHPIAKHPEMVTAQHPEETVINGCIIMALDKYGSDS